MGLVMGSIYIPVACMSSGEIIKTFHDDTEQFLKLLICGLGVRGKLTCVPKYKQSSYISGGKYQYNVLQFM